jgi:Na+/H+-dicarboxylate symporter
MVLTSVGLPIEGVILIVSIDRILDMVTTMVNITGDACVALLVDRSENTFDEKKYYDF